MAHIGGGQRNQSSGIRVQQQLGSIHLKDLLYEAKRSSKYVWSVGRSAGGSVGRSAGWLVEDRIYGVLRSGPLRMAAPNKTNPAVVPGIPF